MTDGRPPTPEEIDFGGPTGPDESDGEMPGMRLISDDVSCANCSHRHACGIVAGIMPMLQDWQSGLFSDEMPINPVMLAQICDYYDEDTEDGT